MNERAKQRARRPALLVVIAVSVLWRIGKDLIGRNFGAPGAVIMVAFGAAVMIGWRVYVKRRARQHGVAEYTPAMVADQLRDANVAPPAFPEDGTLLGASILIVNQLSKLIEVATEYQIFDSKGEVVGHVAQVDQGRLKKFARVVTSFDQFMTHHFAVTDKRGERVLVMTRPRKLFKSRVRVGDGRGQPIGEIVQANVFGKIRFDLCDHAGNRLGSLRAENWRAWDFQVFDHSGSEVARITKTWEGFARTLFSRADTYVVRVGRELDEPFRSLVFATALAVDVALKQDARGFG